jgi:hypothetical protein
VAHRGGAQVKVFQIETGGDLLRVGGAETLQGPLQLVTEAIPRRLRVPRRPPEASQGEVSCPSFTPLGARADWPLNLLQVARSLSAARWLLRHLDSRLVLEPPAVHVSNVAALQ